jgi:hypothetical protein
VQILKFYFFICIFAVLYQYMVNPIHTAALIVEDAEARFRKILADSASDGHFSHIMQLAGWAQSLAQLRSEILRFDTSMTTAARQGKPETSETSSVPPSKSSRKANPIADYPKFVRNGESLIKVGWSKSQRDQYEQKAPFSALSDLVRAITAAAVRKNRFVMDAILPLKGSPDGTDIPNYQVYLCLAWLRKEGLVLQHGRKGYSVKSKADISALSRELFASLPEQQLDGLR